MAQWWERSPLTNVARVQLPASTPYVGRVCCWFSPKRFSPGTPVFPSPQKPTLPNSNSIWNARTRLNEFIWTPRCFVGKQIFTRTKREWSFSLTRTRSFFKYPRVWQCPSKESRQCIQRQNLSHRVPVCTRFLLINSYNSLLCKRFNMALDRVKWGKYPKKCTLIEYGVNVFSPKVLIFDVCPESSFLSHCVARNFCRKFCGSFFFWRIGDFLCFAGTNFCD